LPKSSERPPRTRNRIPLRPVRRRRVPKARNE